VSEPVGAGPSAVAPPRQFLRFLRFLLVGGSGFVIDAGLTYGLVRWGTPPWLARLPAIGCAAVFTWLANRHFTYAVRTAHSAGEALRYAAVAAAMAVLNYGIYLLILRWGAPPLLAVTVATACQTVVSFHAYRRFAFRQAH